MSRDYVAVPRIVLEQPLSGTEAAVWVLIASLRRHHLGEDETWPKRAWLMARLGRPDRQADVVTRATTRLHTLGLLTKRFARHHGRTLTMYRLPARQGEAYVHAEHQLLAWLQDRRLTPEQLLSLLRWRDACGSECRTDDTVAEFAERYSDAARNVKRHRAALVRLGLLHTEHHPGLPTITRLPDEWSLRELLASPERSTGAPDGARMTPVDNPEKGSGTGAKSARPPGPHPPDHPGQKRPTTGAKNALQERAPVERAPVEQAPDEQAAVNPSSASVQVRARKAV